MELEETESKSKNLTHVSFRDANYLYYSPLDESNVMDYFYLSPFYDKNSINQKCIVQKLDFNIQRLSMSGNEFYLELSSKEKDLYYISKSFRERNKVTLLNYYYIFKGTIFQSPDVYSLILSTVESLSHNFTNILNEVNKDN